MDIRNLGYSAAFYRAVNATVAGTTAINGTGVDMLSSFGGPFDCICFVAGVGTLTATQQTILKAQGSTDNATWTGTGGDLLASHQGPPPDADSNKLLVLDIFRPQFRYVRPVVSRGTANAVVDFVLGILYNAHSLPITTQPSTVSTPATGGSGSQGAGAAVPVNVIRYAGLGTA